jgi:hypothetical protein
LCNTNFTTGSVFGEQVRREAEVPMMEEGLFLSISKGVPTPEMESKRTPDEILRLKSRKKAYKIYSKILEDYLWIVATDKERQELVSEGIRDVIYTQEEVSKLMGKNITKEGLVAIHKIKKAFAVATVGDIENE